MMKLIICGRSDVGKKRDHNEDVFLIGNAIENISPIYTEIPIESLFIRTYGLLLAVADGMGGHNAGEVASDISLNLLTRRMIAIRKDRLKAEEIVDMLRDSIMTAHEEILNMSNSSPEHHGMGTTIAGLYFHGENLYTFHAGDSRVYRFRNGVLFQITKDHSFVQSLIDIGQLNREDSYSHPQKNVITNSLGGGTDKCEPEVTDKYSYFDNDIFLICSDGLSDMVDEKSLENILGSAGTIVQKVDKLISYANEHGGEDNITLILIEIQNSEDKETIWPTIQKD